MSADGKRGPSMTGRAIEAIALLVGFYVLAIVIALFLIATPILEIVYLDRIHFYLLAVAFGGLGLLWALVPRREPWVEPGIRFDASTQPQLWAAITSVAHRANQKPPNEAYLLDDVNAFVTSRGTVLGLGGKRVVGIGVPLLAVLDAQELESVLAHEFGHFDGGDTKLGPVVYATHNAIGRTMGAVRMRWVASVFVAYFKFYLRRTQSVSRAQEFAADRLAARLTSPDVTAAALARVEVGANAYSYFLREEYTPVVNANFRPPYFEGLVRTLASQRIREHAASDTAIGRDAHSAFDSHPPTADRIRALGIDPQRLDPAPHTDGGALHLLADPQGVEADLVRRHLRVPPESLAAIAWADVGGAVLVPAWRDELGRTLGLVAPELRPHELPVDDEGLAALGAEVFRVLGRAANQMDRIAVGRRVGTRFLMLAAADAGWTPTVLLGDEIAFVRDGQTLALLDAWERVTKGDLGLDTWREGLASAGLAESVREAAQLPEGSGSDGAALAPAPAPAAEAMSYRLVPPGTKELLAIEGPVLSYGAQRVCADDVTAVYYGTKGNKFEAEITARTGVLKFELKTDKKPQARETQARAWHQIKNWAERYVVPRLADPYLEQLLASGQVQLAGVRVTRDGVEADGRAVTWSEFAGWKQSSDAVELYVRAPDTLEGHRRFAKVAAREPGAVLLPELLDAAPQG
jgi:Zn-dependent protease with chaperone function